MSEAEKRRNQEHKEINSEVAAWLCPDGGWPLTRVLRLVSSWRPSSWTRWRGSPRGIPPPATWWTTASAPQMSRNWQLAKGIFHWLFHNDVRYSFSQAPALARCREQAAVLGATHRLMQKYLSKYKPLVCRTSGREDQHRSAGQEDGWSAAEAALRVLGILLGEVRAGCSHMWIMVEIFRPGHGAPRDKSHKENLIKMLHFHDNAEKVRIRRSSLC